MFIGEAGDLDVAEPDISNQTVKHHQRVGPLGAVMIEVRMARYRDIDRNFRKFVRKPFTEDAGRIIAPRIDKNRQTFRRGYLECIVTVKLNFDVTRCRRISAILL